MNELPVSSWWLPFLATTYIHPIGILKNLNRK